MAIPLKRLEGKYEILEKLREGGMGAIYKVRHRLLGEVRVIKVIRPIQQEQDPSLKARFLKEARAAAKLSHPNIAQIYDFTVDEEGVAYLVMEFIQGMTLGELMRDNAPVPIELALEIARQGLRAIGHIHRRGIVHRDISTDNLMLSRDVDGRPLVKLIDLGLAKAIEGGSQLTGAGVFVGKLRYAAPEQFDDSARVDHRRSDLYSFAVVLYELLTGRYPIAGSSPSSLIAGHLFRPPLDFAESDPQGRVPERARRAVLKSLAKDPQERFANAKDFAAALGDDQPDVLETAEIRSVVESTQTRIRSLRAPRPGSTQVRLDRQFLPEPTPLPAEDLSSAPTLILKSSEADAAADPVEVADPAEINVSEIEELIEGGEFSEARRRIERLELDSPGHPRIAELEARLVEVQEIASRPVVRELLRAAQQEADRDDYTAALGDLRRALELAPRDEQVRSLFDATERAARQRHEELVRERAIAEHAERIEALLAAGEVDEAARSLRRAGESLGGHPRFTRLRQRIEERTEVEPKGSEVSSETISAEELLREAQTLHRAGRLQEAITRARQARELAPDHKMIELLIFELERELATGEADEARAAARRDAAEEIRQLVEGGELGAAAQRFPEALEVAGPTFVLKNLQDRLAGELDAAKGARSAEISPAQRADSLVGAARSRAQTEDFGEARELLREALALDPGHPEALALQASVEACLKVEEEEQQEAEEVERTVIGIRTLLDEGRTSDAETGLRQAENRFGDRKELQKLRYQTAQARLEEDDTRFLDSPATQSETPDRRPPEPEVPDRRPPERRDAGRRPDDLVEVTARIRALTSDGKTGEALETLQSALLTHGQLEVLRKLRYELSERMLGRDAEEEEVSGSRALATGSSYAETPSMGIPAAGAPAAGAPAAGTPAAPAPSGPSGPSGPMVAPPGAAPPAGPAGGRHPGDGNRGGHRFDEIPLDGFAGGSDPEPPAGLAAPGPSAGGAAPKARRSPPGRQSSRLMIAALLVIIVFLFLGVLLRYLSTSREATPGDQLVVQDVQAQVLRPGFVELDAVPWGEVVRIVQATAEPGAAPRGARSEDPPITPSRFTPVALELPPGRYQLTVRYPPTGVSEEIEVEVASGQRIEHRLSFEEFDGKRYFEKVGW